MTKLKKKKLIKTVYVIDEVFARIHWNNDKISNCVFVTEIC